MVDLKKFDEDDARMIKAMAIHAKSSHLSLCKQCPLEYSSEEDDDGNYEGECTFLFANAALRIIENLQKTIEEQEERIAIMEEGGWRKVEDGLPDAYLDVWVYTTDMKVKSGSRVNSYWYLNDLIAEIDDNYVTHWQYKHDPEPPKVGEQE